MGEFQRRVIREREHLVNEGLRINVVFDIPGRFSSPDYDGVLATRLDRRNQHLLVLAAVPADLQDDQVDAYLVEVLWATLDQATAFLRKRRASIKVDHVAELITTLATDLEANAD